MQIVVNSLENLKKYLHLVTFTQWMNEVEYARKIQMDAKKKIVLFYDQYYNPYLCLNLNLNYKYIIHVTYRKSYVPQVTLCIESMEPLDPSPLYRN